MHAALAHSAFVLAAAGEKSKVAFYVAGGATAAWAVVLGLLGLSRPDFPGNLGGQRVVIAVSAVLVVASIATAIGTASKPPAAAAAAAAAQGSSSSPSAQAAAAPSTTPGGGGAPPPAGPVAIAADPSGQIAFTTKALRAHAGTVAIAFTNASQTPHNLTILRGGAALGATPTFAGGEKTLSVSLKPGTYTFECTVPGHAQLGMKGTLTVS